MSEYRYIQDVMFSVGETGENISVGLMRDAWWVMRLLISRHGMVRWVAPPDEGIISTETMPITIVCDPPTDGVRAYVIFDTESDRTLHPASWRDYRIVWGYWEDDPDNEIPWWKKKPRLVAYRRRVKPAKMWAETTEWLGGLRKVSCGALYA